MVVLGTKAPGFNLKGVMQGKISDYSLEAYKGKWVVLFFYPADFTFICPTEVTGFSKFASEFRPEQAEILGVSVDSVEGHRQWAEEPAGSIILCAATKRKR